MKALTVRESGGDREAGRAPGGPGLYLQITDAEVRSWLHRYMIGGRARNMGLGPCDLVTLAQAREKVLAGRQMLLTTRTARGAPWRACTGDVDGGGGDHLSRLRQALHHGATP